jgi:phosphoserine aminotransferase
MYNTPPTFSYVETKEFLFNTFSVLFYFRIYIANKMFDWIKQQGGLKAMNQLSDKKSTLVYETIEESNGFYVNAIAKKYRSRVNIPLRIVSNGTPNEKLESLFLNEAIKSNMIELKGHRAVGGIRISLYNGVNLEETTKLIDFMRAFQKNNS